MLSVYKPLFRPLPPAVTGIRALTREAAETPSPQDKIVKGKLTTCYELSCRVQCDLFCYAYACCIYLCHVYYASIICHVYLYAFECYINLP